jgi:hypothetical protein
MRSNGCVYPKAVYCEVHPPIDSELPRQLALVGDDYDHIYDLLYRNTLVEWLGKSLSGSYDWIEPSKDRGRHFIIHKGGKYHIEFISMAQGGKNKLRGKRKLFFYVDELPPFDAYRELRMRILRYSGQTMIGATHDQLLDSRTSGQWIFKELVGVKNPRIQVVSISTRNNPVMDKEDLENLILTMTDEEVEIRVDGGFGYKASRCVFSGFALERQQSYITEPKEYYLGGSFPPSQGTEDWNNYFGGSTRFPEGCVLPSVDKKILVHERMGSGRGGVACVNCPSICHLYQAPPLAKASWSLSPVFLESKEFDNLTGDVTPKLLIWELPVKGGLYIAGSDACRGRQGGDFAAFPVFNAMTGKQAALLYGRFRTMDFAFYSAGVSVLYNNCYIVPEANPPGDEVIMIWTEMLGLKNIYVDPVRKVRLPSGDTMPFIGFLTTGDSKRHQLVRRLEELCRAGVIQILHNDTVREMSNFISDSGKLGAIQGEHDDLVIGTGLVAVGWEHMSRIKLVEPDLPIEDLDPESARYDEMVFMERMRVLNESLGGVSEYSSELLDNFLLDNSDDYDIIR